MSDHRKNEPFKKCRPIYITHVLIGAISCNPALWEVWWQSFHNKKKILLFSLTSLLLPCAYERIRNRRRPVATSQLEQIDESQSFSAVCSIYCSFYHLSCFLLLLLLSSCLYRPGGPQRFGRVKSQRKNQGRRKRQIPTTKVAFVNALIT